MPRKSRKIKLAEAIPFEKPGFSGRRYVQAGEALGFTALMVEANGQHPEKQLTDTTRCYLVLSGSGTFRVDDRFITVTADDLIVVQPDSPYSYEGTMRLFEFNVSPNNSFE